MTEDQTIEATDEVVEVVVEAVVKRGRGRPRKEKPIKEKRPPGKPKKFGPMKEKRPVGRPRTWAAENRPKYKPKDHDYHKKYYRNGAQAKVGSQESRVTRYPRAVASDYEAARNYHRRNH